MAETLANPTVSVVIPTYNRAHLLGRAIQSVLNQTYHDFEIIVVDDGSTDNTEEVVKSFNDPRIHYTRHDQNRGGSAARNTGIKMARGEYIAFQDSDDEWLPEKLQKQMKVFESAPPEVGVVYTGFWRIECDKRIYIPSGKISRKEGNIQGELLKGNFVTTQATVLKKECFEKAGMFDQRLPRFQDWELFIRISKYYEFKCIDEPLVISYFTPVSISSNQRAQVEAFGLILEKHYRDIAKSRKLLANYQYTFGNLLCQNGDLGQGRDYLIKALRLYPLNLKYIVATLASLLGEGAYAKVVRLKRKIRSIDA